MDAWSCSSRKNPRFTPAIVLTKEPAPWRNNFDRFEAMFERMRPLQDALCQVKSEGALSQKDTLVIAFLFLEHRQPMSVGRLLPFVVNRSAFGQFRTFDALNRTAPSCR
jgi:hypothetical protein